MALIKFKNIEDSFYAIAEMHNKQVLGRKIQISFTKSKLYWYHHLFSNNNLFAFGLSLINMNHMLNKAFFTYNNNNLR